MVNRCCARCCCRFRKAEPKALDEKAQVKSSRGQDPHDISQAGLRSPRQCPARGFFPPAENLPLAHSGQSRSPRSKSPRAVSFFDDQDSALSRALQESVSSQQQHQFSDQGRALDVAVRSQRQLEAELKKAVNDQAVLRSKLRKSEETVADLQASMREKQQTTVEELSDAADQFSLQSQSMQTRFTEMDEHLKANEAILRQTEVALLTEQREYERMMKRCVALESELSQAAAERIESQENHERLQQELAHQASRASRFQADAEERCQAYQEELDLATHNAQEEAQSHRQQEQRLEEQIAALKHRLKIYLRDRNVDRRRAEMDSAVNSALLNLFPLASAQCGHIDLIVAGAPPNKVEAKRPREDTHREVAQRQLDKQASEALCGPEKHRREVVGKGPAPPLQNHPRGVEVESPWEVAHMQAAQHQLETGAAEAPGRPEKEWRSCLSQGVRPDDSCDRSADVASQLQEQLRSMELHVHQMEASEALSAFAARVPPRVI